MELYLAGTDVAVAVALQDRNGNTIAATALQYDVVDVDGNVKVAQQDVPGFTVGATEADITVPASANELADGNWREVRTVRLYCTVGANVVQLNYSFGLELADPLILGGNTFQSLAQAEITALDIPNLSGWSAATDDDKIAALIDARVKICQLSYYLLNSNINFAQDSLNYIPEGAFQSQYVATNSLFIFNGNLALLNAQQYSQLPERFKLALRKAQVTEADHILGDDVIGQKRDSGIILDSVGQTKQMFRNTKPLDLPVCKRALRFLSYFLVFNRTIGR